MLKSVSVSGGRDDASSEQHCPREVHGITIQRPVGGGIVRRVLGSVFILIGSLQIHVLWGTLCTGSRIGPLTPGGLGWIEGMVQGVFTWGDARSFLGADVKNPTIGFKVNFDADVKRTTPRRQCVNHFRQGQHMLVTRDRYFDVGVKIFALNDGFLSLTPRITTRYQRVSLHRTHPFQAPR